MLASARYQQRQQKKARKKRLKRGEPALVHYFHQVDDPYSHLAVQKLDELKGAYSLPFRSHLVSKPGPEYRGSADHADAQAWHDAKAIAAGYGATFSPSVSKPDAQSIAAANATLADTGEDRFAETAVRLGSALWQGDVLPAAQGRSGVAATTSGDQLRHTLGHYQGAMFYFDGEWYWGVDRLRLLEARLIEEGYGASGAKVRVPQPAPTDTSNLDTSAVLLEYFPSLRSPYTAIGHQRVLDLIARSGVRVAVRPVMPMLMRGVPAPRAKQRYIITDAAREARAWGVPLGKIVDPFGEPVKRAFALYPGVVAQQRELEFVTAYLQASWFDGIDITREAGLRRVCSDAGLNWQQLRETAQGADWQTPLQDNLDSMLSANLWGVPSFRVSGPDADTEAFACWGQDRIWRVENEIAARA